MNLAKNSDMHDTSSENALKIVEKLSGFFQENLINVNIGTKVDDAPIAIVNLPKLVDWVEARHEIRPHPHHRSLAEVAFAEALNSGIGGGGGKSGSGGAGGAIAERTSLTSAKSYYKNSNLLFN
ncbi:hypothetical protein GQX74_007382 [Glossina fuscipes]|nr:hypothetical protein GQX74_007382 [Glossina fuscipes]